VRLKSLMPLDQPQVLLTYQGWLRVGA